MCLAIAMIPVGIIGGILGLTYSLLLIILIFGVTFVVSFMLSFFITKPIEKLTKNIDEISKGKLDVNLENSEIFEINNLTHSLNRVMASLKLAVHKVGVKKGEIFEDAVKVKEAFEKKQDDLFNSISGWAWETDSKGFYTFCSNNIIKLLGYNQEEIIGNSMYDFMFPEDGKKAKQVFNEASSKNIPINNFENWNVCKNGEKICVITNGVPFYDEFGKLEGFRGVDTNITGEKIAINKVKELKVELSNVKTEINSLLNERENKRQKTTNLTGKKKVEKVWSEHEFDSVFISDENANILDCNENMYKRLGYSKSEILSLNMADFDALESKEDIKGKIQLAKKNGVINFKTIHKRKDGSAILVHENLQYDKNKGNFKCIVREDYSLKKSKK